MDTTDRHGNRIVPEQMDPNINPPSASMNPDATVTSSPKPPPDTSWIRTTEIREGWPASDPTDSRLQWLAVFLGGAAFGTLLCLVAVWLLG